MPIIVDSACDYNKKLVESASINFEKVPLSLQVNEKQFIDDDFLIIDDYLDEVDKSSLSPKTAAPSPELFMEKYKKEGSVFVVTLSSQLSASFSNAILAKKMYLEEVGQKFIHVFDSQSASVGETLVALQINSLIKAGLSDIAIVEKITQFIKNTRTFFILEKYDTLVKSGRLNPYVAKIISMLSIKPICRGVNGKMEFFDKARGYKKAATKLIDAISREDIDFSVRTLAISHVNCLQKAKDFRDEVFSRIKFKDAFIVEASGLCATYANREGIIISY